MENYLGSLESGLANERAKESTLRNLVELISDEVNKEFPGRYEQPGPKALEPQLRQLRDSGRTEEDLALYQYNAPGASAQVFCGWLRLAVERERGEWDVRMIRRTIIMLRGVMIPGMASGESEKPFPPGSAVPYPKKDTCAFNPERFNKLLYSGSV
ncbi:MAG: hypothetical protein FWC27_09560 [Firmicutes bacterium]|nr:hypothetical protein [Bacillota bacterium]